VRIERNAAPRRSLRRLAPGRRADVDVTIALPSAEALFESPEVDPFSPRYAEYEDRAALDALAFELQADRLPACVHATLVLPSDALEPGLVERIPDAVRRYCARRVSVLDTEVRRVNRHGVIALVIGFLAVIALNAVARTLSDATDDVLLAISDGLQVVSWVTLWFPINLLVYDRWYYRRERRVYRLLGSMPVTIVPDDARPPAPAGRSTAP
jgi:hypothetical protein